MAVMPYVRLPLSLRNVDDLLQERLVARQAFLSSLKELLGPALAEALPNALATAQL